MLVRLFSIETDTQKLLDRMGRYFFDDHQTGTFDITDLTLPHDGLWSQATSSDWIQLHRRVDSKLHAPLSKESC